MGAWSIDGEWIFFNSVYGYLPYRNRPQRIFARDLHFLRVIFWQSPGTLIDVLLKKEDYGKRQRR
jgi:hypothetical protein